jgi:two-component system, NtrC family, response regulator HydG
MVVDDEPHILIVIDRFARGLGFDVVRQSDGREALASFPQARPDVLLVDMQMSDVGGLDVLKTIRALDSDCPVILMTGHPSVDAAMDAVKLGALDYLSKPLDFDRLGALLAGIRAGIDRRAQLSTADANVARQFEFHGMIGRGPAMQDLFDTLRRLAPHVRTVLVTGETGTGKELVARALHALAAGPKAQLVIVNCSAVVASLFESELFGHQRGAFTGATDNKPGLFERAHGGTLFLDEIGELPLALQAKLLRAVEHGEVQRVGSVEDQRVEVRIIAATNRDLRAEAAAGRFRSDLFYRLSVIEIRTIPLRERREDIAYLTAAFLGASAARLKKKISGVTPAAERLLQNAAWPGNIRELSHVIERACILSDGLILSERDLAAAMSIVPPAEGADDDPNLMANAQRGHVERVLSQVGGNKTAAARMLGISRRSIYRRLDRRSTGPVR